MVLSLEDKAEAVRRVAESVTFHRAEVLKALLEYLHAQETLGRAHEVTEPEIALKVMRRGSAFSPESDSSVRTRFFALRRKLDEYYSGEGRDAHVRLDIPRGTYTLRFVPNVVEPEPDVPAPSALPPEPPPPSSFGKPFLVGALTGIALLAVAAGAWTMLGSKSSAVGNSLLIRAWGPMIDPGSNVTIAIGTPASFFIRDFGDAEPPAGDPVYRLPITRDAAFEEWYKRTRNAHLGKSAILHPNAHSPLWGDAAAAGVLSRMFGAHGILVDQAPSARVHPVALRDRNAVIIGRPEYTEAARAFIPDDGLSIEYSAVDRAVGIHNRSPKEGEPKWWFAAGGLRRNYGLITILSAGGAAKQRIVLLAGINSDGAEAGARFLTSTDRLEDLDRRFRQAGVNQWPPRYQVVVRTESVDTYSLQTQFEFLRILK